VNLTRADADDASALADCWVDLAAEQRQHGSHLRASANREDIRETILRAIVTNGVFVARAEAGDDVGFEPGTILGFVMCSVESDYLETTVTRGTVENLYVRPAVRGRGIGSDLLARAEASLADRDVDVVKLEVMAPNEAARRFYRRHGYEPHRVTMAKSTGSDTHSKDGA
jgi:ribosomal protein S18 acetylase RimI-like enzyme